MSRCTSGYGLPSRLTTCLISSAPSLLGRTLRHAQARLAVGGTLYRWRANDVEPGPAAWRPLQGRRCVPERSVTPRTPAGSINPTAGFHRLARRSCSQAVNGARPMIGTRCRRAVTALTWPRSRPCYAEGWTKSRNIQRRLETVRIDIQVTDVTLPS